MRKFAAWARCAAWMVFIFMMSAMPGDVSGEQSGFVTEMIEKVLTFVFGAQTAGWISVDALEMVVRKCAHMGEYAVLFWLWAHALSAALRRRVLEQGEDAVSAASLAAADLTKVAWPRDAVATVAEGVDLAAAGADGAGAAGGEA